MMPVANWCVTCRQDGVLRLGSELVLVPGTMPSRYISLCLGCNKAYAKAPDVLCDAWTWLAERGDAPRSGEHKEESPRIDTVLQDVPGPPKVKHLCACQCGTMVNEGQRFVPGHEA